VVIRRIHPLKWWISLACALLVMCMVVPIGVGVWFTITTEQHACQALDLIVAHPVPKPADPLANPSREANYQFYQAILLWHNQNGCL
jgi:hypothetical protein